MLDLVRRLGQEHGKTVITVLHDLNLASTFADHVVMVRQGKAGICGPTKQVITPENIRMVFDFDADVFMREDRLVCLPRQDAQMRANAE